MTADMKEFLEEILNEYKTEGGIPTYRVIELLELVLKEAE